MKKHLAPPNYFRIMGLVGAALVVIGLGLLVTHVTQNSTYFAVYAGAVFLLIGTAGMVFFKPRT